MITGRAIRLILSLCLTCAAPVAQAETSVLPTPLAVGRISYGAAVPKPNAPICTGTLVAPDLVLTADHCLRGSLKSSETVYFAAGLQDGATIAVGRGQEVILADPSVAKPDWAMDVALLRLSGAMADASVLPLGIGNPLGDAFTVIAYARRAPDLQTRDDDCFAMDHDGDVIGLSCAVVSGNSGAPVLMRDGENLRVVGVVVAATTGIPATLAAPIPTVLAERIGAGE